MVDRIECVHSADWTTKNNVLVQPELGLAATAQVPPTVSKADLVLDCNADFMFFEREHGGVTPYGIAEFWLRHHGLYRPGIDLMPFYETRPKADAEVDAWVQEKRITNPMVGIVLKAGSDARDWNHGDKATSICEWLYTRGLQPVTFDPFQRAGSNYAESIIGKPLDFVASALKRCRLVVSPDTGLLHMAQAVGVPSVAIWGIMDPMLRVAGYNTVVVPRRSLGFCAAQNPQCQCHWRFQQWSCLRRLTLTHVLEGIEEALRERCPQ